MKKRSLVKWVAIGLGIVESLIVIGFIVFQISVAQYEIVEADSEDFEAVEEPERDIIDSNLYNADEITADMIGKKVAVVGFMCNDVATDVSAAWITRKPFKEKADVTGEIRVDTGSIIQYTPLPVEIIGRVMEDNQVDGDALPIKLGEAEIYIYGGSDPEYKRIKDILEANLIADIVVAIDTIETTGIGDINKEALEADYTKCAELAETGLRELIGEILNYTSNEVQDRIDFADELKNKLTNAIYNNGGSEK